MESSVPNNSSFGNHGDGAQTLHTGQGSQAIVQNGHQYNIENLIQNFHQPEMAELLMKVWKKDNEGGLQDGNSSSVLSLVDDLLEWLEPQPKFGYIERQRLLFAQRTPGTGQWLLEATEFLEWKRTANGFLWLDGIIGAGKSTLMSVVIDDLQKMASNKQANVCLIYIYFQEEGDINPTMESLLANLLRQLLQQNRPRFNVSQSLQQAYEECQSHGILPSSDELLNLLVIESEAYSKVYLIIDALDACTNTSDYMIQDKFVRSIRKLPENWNIMASSRLGTLLGSRIESDLAFHIEAQACDIKLYVEMRIRESNAMTRFTEEAIRTDSSFRKTICDTVIQKAQGIFLLAKLHLDTLEVQGTLGHFREMLRKLPEDLTETFEAALLRIDKQTDFERKVAKHVLSWLLFSMRPPTVEEVRYAYAVDWRTRSFDSEKILGENHLTSYCAGLVVVDQDRRILRPVHDTILGYLRNWNSMPDDLNSHMALQCMTYISMKDFSQEPSSKTEHQEIVLEYPLMKYATDHWFNHVRRVEKGDDLEKDLETRIPEFLKDARTLPASIGLGRYRPITGLHTCAYFGTEHWAKSLIATGVEVDLAGEDGRSPLHWAVFYNHPSIVSVLVHHRADANIKDKKGSTPLHLAVQGDNGPVVSQLIKAGARLSCRDNQGRTPLICAIRLGFTSIAKLLLGRTDDIDEVDADGFTPFREAVTYSTLDIVQVLLESGCDVNQRSKDGWTALRHASQYGNEQLALLLLRKGAEVDLRDEKGGLTPLRWAILHGHALMVKLLLDWGADPNVTHKDGLTPLIQAAKGGNESATWLLVSHRVKGKKVELDDTDHSGSTPLHYAVKNGYASIMWLLVIAGADLDIMDDEGRTALHLAIQNGDSPTVWLLIEKGAALSVADINGIQPLHLAARLGQAPILQLLAKKGVDLNQQDKKGLTALHHAANAGKEECVLILIDSDANSNIADAEGLTCLHHAVLGKEIETIMKLGSLKPSILDCQDKGGRTALMYAAQRGNDLAALGLFKKGANISIQDADSWTARDHAANGNHTFMISFLNVAGT
ncbi:hypothetical protein JX266_009533 [Neoarthrinium moseri]|nr:hypothetical protein JX266_009533 [Neoarthrinium moseri]